MLKQEEAELLRVAQKNGFLLTKSHPGQRGEPLRQLVLLWSRYCEERKVADIRIVHGNKQSSLCYTLTPVPWCLSDSGVNELRNAVIRINKSIGKASWDYIDCSHGRIDHIPTEVLDKILAEVLRVFANYKLSY